MPRLRVGEALRDPSNLIRLRPAEGGSGAQAGFPHPMEEERPLIAPASPAVTVWLSVLLGAYLIAGGIGALAHGRDWPEIVAEFERSPALVAVTGAVAFAVGAVIVSVHNQWTSPAAIIVSLAGWWAVVEGLVLVAVPDLYLRLTRPLMKASRFWGIFMIAVGAFLLSAAIVPPFNPTL